MDYWDIEQRDGVVIAGYKNPPTNYLVAPATIELNEMIASWREPDVRVVVLTSAVPDRYITHYIAGDCFCALSADLQDPPELIEKMVDYWLNGEKFVICVREQREDPPLTTFFANFFYRLVRSFVIHNYPRGGFDLALMDKAMLPYMLASGKNINTALFAYSLGFEPVTISYKRQKRKYGKSRWTFAKKFNYFIDSILGFSVLPLHMISWVGITLAIVSFFYGLYVILDVLIRGIEVPGFASLFTLTAFLFGITLTMLGIIGQYIWRIFDEINGAPESVIEIELLE